MKIFILLWIMVLILSGYASCIVSSTYGPASSTYWPATTGAASESYLIDAPTPPNLNSEQIVLPDFNLLKPNNFQLAMQPQSPSGISPSLYTSRFSAIPHMPGCANCREKTVWTGCNLQAWQASYGSAIAQGCQAIYPQSAVQAVYPQPAVSRYNKYYIQVYCNQLCNQAGVRCGERLILLSNIGRTGTYWSYEWAQCGSAYCYPEVKNFGIKGSGWYQTWFNSNKPGWHILSYWCNDWSNYIYIYVWPSS